MSPFSFPLSQLTSQELRGLKLQAVRLQVEGMRLLYPNR